MRKAFKIANYTFWCIALFFIVGVLYSRITFVKTREIEKGLDLKIVHLTDTHFTDDYKRNIYDKVIDSIIEYEPDVVIFTGDLFQEEIISYKLQKEITELLSEIDCEYKFAVFGNHDLRYVFKTQIITQIFADSGFTLLTNENTQITVNDVIYNIIGLDDYTRGNVNYTPVLETANDYENNIVLSHEPDTFTYVYDYNVFAMFSGHSHGGQFRFPIIGDIDKFAVYGAQTYNEKYYKVHNTELFVSFGLGEGGTVIRFWNPRKLDFYKYS